MKIRPSGITVTNEDDENMYVLYNSNDIVDGTFSFKIGSEEWWCDNPDEFLKMLSSFIADLEYE